MRSSLIACPNGSQPWKGQQSAVTVQFGNSRKNPSYCLTHGRKIGLETPHSSVKKTENAVLPIATSSIRFWPEGLKGIFGERFSNLWSSGSPNPIVPTPLTLPRAGLPIRSINGPRRGLVEGHNGPGELVGCRPVGVREAFGAACGPLGKDGGIGRLDG